MQFQRSDHWQVCAASTTAERLGGTTIQMFYANPTTVPTRPHIDRCSRPTKPIRFASSPPDCLFTEGTCSSFGIVLGSSSLPDCLLTEGTWCSSFGIPDKNRDFPSLSSFICFLDQLPLLFAHPDRKCVTFY